MAVSSEPDRILIERLVGMTVRHAERAPWGFTNRTDILTVISGERVAVQRYADRPAAEHRVHFTTILRDRLEAAGINVPRLIRADLESDPPYAMFEALPGVPGPTFLAQDQLVDAWLVIAAAMGRMLTQVSSVTIGDIQLPYLWTEPDSLASQAERWLHDVRPRLSVRAAHDIQGRIDTTPALFEGRRSVLAHGDYVPANVLMVGDRVSALLDWESVRLADPLFDVAWWGWIVRHHHPEQFAAAWHPFLEAAGRDPREQDFGNRILVLQILRLLELAFSSNDSGANRMWTRRLDETVREDPRRDGSITRRR